MNPTDVSRKLVPHLEAILRTGQAPGSPRTTNPQDPMGNALERDSAFVADLVRQTRPFPDDLTRRLTAFVEEFLTTTQPVGLFGTWQFGAPEYHPYPEAFADFLQESALSTLVFPIKTYYEITEDGAVRFYSGHYDNVGEPVE